MHYYVEGVDVKGKTDQHIKKKLFLKWALINLLTVGMAALTVFLGYSQAANLNIIGKVMVAAIVIVYLAAAVYAGVLCWQSDELGADLAVIRHNADHVEFAANEEPYIGLLGAVTGIFVFMSGTGGLGGSVDPNHLKEIMSASMSSLGIAFVPTIVGIFFRIVLNCQHHLIVHEIGTTLGDYEA